MYFVKEKGGNDILLQLFSFPGTGWIKSRVGLFTAPDSLNVFIWKTIIPCI